MVHRNVLFVAFTYISAENLEEFALYLSCHIVSVTMTTQSHGIVRSTQLSFVCGKIQRTFPWSCDILKQDLLTL